MRPLIADLDLNFPSDDFQALLLIQASAAFDLLGCTAVAGNTWMEEVCLNIRGTLDLLDLTSIPVHPGNPWNKLGVKRNWALKQALDGHVPFIGAFEKNPTPRVNGSLLEQKSSSKSSAKNALIEAGKKHAGALEILATGPLTNIANAIQRSSSFAENVRQITFMGGNFSPNTLQDRADFNVWFDAKSAQRVFSSGINIRIIPLDICRTVRSHDSLMESLCRIQGGLADIFTLDYRGMSKQHGTAMALCDQLTALVAIDDTLVRGSKRGWVHVDISKTKTHGQTLFIPDPNGSVEIATEVDGKRAHAKLEQLVAKMAVMHANTNANGWQTRVV